MPARGTAENMNGIADQYPNYPIYILYQCSHRLQLAWHTATSREPEHFSIDVRRLDEPQDHIRKLVGFSEPFWEDDIANQAVLDLWWHSVSHGGHEEAGRDGDHAYAEPSQISRHG